MDSPLSEAVILLVLIYGVLRRNISILKITRSAIAQRAAPKKILQGGGVFKGENMLVLLDLM